MRRTYSVLLTVSLFLVATGPVEAGSPFGRGGSFGFGLGFFPPSYYGYPLDDISAGYYGGSRYREYYSYGRGYGLANYPGPVPGPMYRQSYVEPPKRLPPSYPPPPPPEYTGVPAARTVAYLTLEVPEDAEVWLEGVKTRQSGPTRLFVSPSLDPGGRYSYEVRVRWPEGEQTREVVVRPGDRLNLRFPSGPDLEELPTPRPFPLR